MCSSIILWLQAIGKSRMPLRYEKLKSISDYQRVTWRNKSLRAFTLVQLPRVAGNEICLPRAGVSPPLKQRERAQ